MSIGAPTDSVLHRPFQQGISNDSTALEQGPLSEEQVESITDAGAASPYRNWGTKWPYFVSRSIKVTDEADAR